MKKLIVLFTCITIAAQAADEYHTFTADDGRTLSAKVLSFNSKSGQVLIQLDDLQTFQLNSAAFSEGDQAYIKQWAPCSLFMSPAEFSIIPRRTTVKSCRKGIDEGESEGEVYSRDMVSEYEYGISIYNRTGLPMENLTLNYLIYYAYDLPVSEENIYPHESHQWQHADGAVEQWSLTSAPNIKVIKGSIPIAGLAPGGLVSFATERVAVLEQNSNSPGWESGIGSAGSSSGMIITMSMQTPDGGYVERSVSMPENIDQVFLQEATGAIRTVGKNTSIPGRNS